MTLLSWNIPLSLALGVKKKVELIFTYNFFFLATEFHFKFPGKLYYISCFQILLHQALHFFSFQEPLKGEKGTWHVGLSPAFLQPAGKWQSPDKNIAQSDHHLSTTPPP